MDGADRGFLKYNEYNPAFPPPPIALPPETLNGSGQTLGHDEMAAILDSGFDDPSPPTTLAPRVGQKPHGSSPLQDSTYPMWNGHDYGYIPETPNMPHSGDSVSSSVESRHAKKRSGGAGHERYGPLGPLADDDTGWGGRQDGGFKGRKI